MNICSILIKSNSSLDWNVTFPAVTLCELFNGGKTWELSEKFVPEKKNLSIDSIFDEFKRNIFLNCLHADITG